MDDDPAFQLIFKDLLKSEEGCANWVSTHLAGIHGLWEFSLGRYDVAIEDLRRATDLDPGNRNAKIWLLRAYEREMERLGASSLADRLRKEYARSVKQLKEELRASEILIVSRIENRARADPSVLNECAIQSNYGFNNCKDETVMNKPQSLMMTNGEYYHGPTSVARRRFVVIGLNEIFAHSLQSRTKLEYAESDAYSIGNSLLDHHYEGRFILGSQATTGTILSVLEDEVEQSGPADRLIVYWAGHGVTRDGQGRAFLTAGITDQTHREFAALLFSTLDDILRGHRGIVTVIADSCFERLSDPIFEEKIPTLWRSLVQPESWKISNSNINYLLATQDGGEAFEVDHLKGGIFTHSLLRYFRSSQGDEFDAASACDYARATTRKMAEDLGVAQFPVCHLAGNQLAN